MKYIDVRICPNCGGKHVKVIDSRNRRGEIHRRIKCLDCPFRWSTIERFTE